MAVDLGAGGQWSVEQLPTPAGPVRLGTSRATSSRGVVLVAPGRGDSLELRSEVAARLAAMRLDTVMVEHVGQGGSGRLGCHPDAVHVTDFDVHLDALRAGVRAASTLAGRRPVFLLAHSMGGLLAAGLLAASAGPVTAAVLTAPMWGFAGRLPLTAVGALAATMVAAGRGRRFAAGERPWALPTCLDMRTLDPGRRAALARFGAAHRDLVRGGSTWGWVRAAARSMRQLDSLPLETVAVPVVVVVAAGDTTISNAAVRRHVRRLPAGELVEVDGGHDVLNGTAAVRQQVWAQIEQRFSIA